eukprot:GHVP01059922.1.p1 GENE.GHVP01059922.1~~GHVP01059922.1.p1  ORF type:complete len:219 (+),score=32.75 GHVP01059922.1:53-709(+)
MEIKLFTDQLNLAFEDLITPQVNEFIPSEPLFSVKGFRTTDDGDMMMIQCIEDSEETNKKISDILEENDDRFEVTTLCGMKPFSFEEFYYTCLAVPDSDKIFEIRLCFCDAGPNLSRDVGTSEVFADFSTLKLRLRSCTCDGRIFKIRAKSELAKNYLEKLFGIGEDEGRTSEHDQTRFTKFERNSLTPFPDARSKPIDIPDDSSDIPDDSSNTGDED